MALAVRMDPSLKKTPLLLVISLLAAAAGCASASESDASSAAPEVKASSGTSLTACVARKPCLDALVLKALFNGDLRVKGMFVGRDGTAPTLATEAVTEWLLPSEFAHQSIEIRSKQVGDRLQATIGLGSVDKPSPDGQGTTESGCSFTFTIEGTLEAPRIVEREVEAQCAG